MAQSSSRSDLMDEYHRLAADTLLGAGSNKVAVAILQATENGDVERLQKLLTEHKDLVDARHPDSGDTPLISAARNGNREVVDILLRCGADVTLDNDSGENALDVAGSRLRSHILKSVGHEDRSMSNAKALLQSAWLGDAVQVRRCLSGSHYLDVNGKNSDGLTPLLLVTRDVSFFSQVQTAMEKEYNPVEVLEKLLNNHADVKQADKQGCGPLHMIASSGPSIHATKMVSLLLQHGSDTESLSSSHQSPLHVASSHGHLTVIVALVEEGGADINLQTSDTGDTPLILSVRGGHSEAARYLLSKGADVTMLNDSGDSAMSVANSPRMKRMIKEAWTEQTDTTTAMKTKPVEYEDDERGSGATSPAPPPEKREKSFFITARQMSRSLDLDEHNLIGPNLSGERSPVVPDSPRELREGGVRSEEGSQEMIGGGGGGEEVVSEGEGREDTGTERRMRRRVMSETVLTKSQKRGGKSGGKKGLSSTHPIEKTKSHDSLQSKSTTKTTNRQALKKMTSRTGGSTSLKKAPSRLPSQRTKSGSQDSLYHEVQATNKSRDSHVTNRRQPTRTTQLPPVYTYTSPPTPKPSYQSPERLPNINLSGMKAVKILTVDTKKENFRIRQLPKTKTQATGSESPSLQRSRSLLAPAGNEQNRLTQKRNSTGSLYQLPPPDSKSVLQPNVVAPCLPSPQNPQPMTLTRQPSSYPTFPQRQPSTHSPRKRLQSTPSLQSQGNKINITFPSSQPERSPPISTKTQLSPFQPTQSHPPLSSSQTQTPYSIKPSPPPPPPSQPSSHPPPTLQPTLSVVPELSESLASSVHLTSSTPSTLKDTSQSDFDTVTPEQTHTPNQATPSQNLAPPSGRPHPTTLSPVHGLPPTVGQFYQLTRQPSSSSPSPSPRVMTHYAVVEGSATLSPIWNMELPQSGVSSSAASDYITSVIGALATSPSALPGHRSNPGLDSGHSTDDERGRDEEGDIGSSGSSSETEPMVVVDSTRSLQWKRGKLLGKGAFGKVWEGLLDSAQMIAVKEVELDIAGQKAQSQYEKLKLEVEILRSVRHRNVVSYLGTSMDEDHVYIFMELIPGGSLLSILKRFGALSMKTCSHYTRQIAQALRYLHDNSIVHRDIKGANLMVTPKGVIKLIDFGSAKQNVAGDVYLNSVRGTPYWMAPEVIRGDGHGRKSDVWSLGCTVYEMATTKPPWSEMPPEAAIFQIGSGATVPPLPNHLPTQITTFIHRCVIRDTVERPEAEQLLDDPFLKKFRKKTS